MIYVSFLFCVITLAICSFYALSLSKNVYEKTRALPKEKMLDKFKSARFARNVHIGATLLLIGSVIFYNNATVMYSSVIMAVIGWTMVISVAFIVLVGFVALPDLRNTYNGITSA